MTRSVRRPPARLGRAALLAALLVGGCRFDSAPTGALPVWHGRAAPDALAATALPAGRSMGAVLRPWAEYCSAERGGACAAAPATVALTPDLWTVLEAVQRRLNAAHPYRPEPLGADAWRRLGPGEPGDCEDLALTKRERLIRAGLPAGALRPATCRLRGTPFGPGDGHAVLTVETDRGTFVLGVEGGVVPWDRSECDSWGYRWAGPAWVALGG